jgi:hypothetical protein
MSEEGRRQLALLDLINAHPGKRILDALHAYRATTDVLAGNAGQLRNLIQSLEDPADPLEIGPMGERAKLQQLFGEVFRLFHNFLASVKTLIDHTRNLVNEDFVTKAHRSKYKVSVQQEFASDPLARFMHDFRNYVVHYAVPKIELTHHFLPEPRNIELNIDATAMLTLAIVDGTGTVIFGGAPAQAADLVPVELLRNESANISRALRREISAILPSGLRSRGRTDRRAEFLLTCSNSTEVKAVGRPPTVAIDETFKKAPRAKVPGGEQSALNL